MFIVLLVDICAKCCFSTLSIQSRAEEEDGMDRKCYKCLLGYLLDSWSARLLNAWILSW